MKWLYAVMAFYVMLLPMLPCSEASSCDASVISSTTQHEDEDCTPFCYCNCCSPVAMSALEISDYFLSNDIGLIIQFDRPLFYPGGIYSFWQPPRLG
jgi:hypothetical protein